MANGGSKGCLWEGATSGPMYWLPHVSAHHVTLDVTTQMKGVEHR